jgi:signal transduction histidine kinase
MAPKPSVILNRRPVVIVCSYLLLSPSLGWVDPVLLYPFVLFYLASNVVLGHVADARFQQSSLALHLVSHEFRAPLQLIGGWTQALDGKMFGGVSAEQSVVLNKILRQTDNLTYMVNSILDPARIEAWGKLSCGETIFRWKIFFGRSA